VSIITVFIAVAILKRKNHKKKKFTESLRLEGTSKDHLVQQAEAATAGYSGVCPDGF